jgi:hypothetical protein
VSKQNAAVRILTHLVRFPPGSRFAIPKVNFQRKCKLDLGQEGRNEKDLSFSLSRISNRMLDNREFLLGGLQRWSAGHIARYDGGGT